MYIEKINSPADVKALSVEQMEVLATEVRQALLHKLSEHGGHIGPNLGMVEATIACIMCSIRHTIRLYTTYHTRAIRIKY